MGVAFGLVVLVAGLLIAYGLVSANGIVLAVGFVLIGLCAIFGMQPGWPGGSTD